MKLVIVIFLLFKSFFETQCNTLSDTLSHIYHSPLSDYWGNVTATEEKRFVLTSTDCYSYKNNNKKLTNKWDWISLGLLALSGTFDAFNEYQANRPDDFARKFPFFGHPKDVWRNKWKKNSNGEIMHGKEKFPLSSSTFVFLTDWPHAFRFGRNATGGASLVCFAIGNRKRMPKEIIIRGVITYVITRATEGFIYKRLDRS